MIIVVTGLIGSGKTTAAFYLTKLLKANLIDADMAGRKVLQRNDIKKKLVSVFGKEILTNNKINRKNLGNIVFRSKNSLLKLDKIVHPLMIKEIKKNLNGKINIIDAALFYELKLNEIADKVILIKSSKKILKKRLGKRYYISLLQKEPKKPDVVISNNGTKKEFFAKLRNKAKDS